MFGTPGYENPGTSQPLNVTHAHRPLSMQACVKTASGFGGCNAAVVFTKEKKEIYPFYRESSQYKVIRHVEVQENKVLANGSLSYCLENETFATFIRGAFKSLG